MLSKELAKTPLASQWNTIGIHHHHGIDLPLSAIRSKLSSGIGEFLDLIPLIDWCKQIGFSVIQLLPLNDSGEDPSPYNALSSIALHPIYLSLHALPFLDKAHQLDASLLPSLDELGLLNISERVEYAKVLTQKSAWLQRYYDLIGNYISSLPDYLAFLKENPWINGYALYKTLKTSISVHTWQEWPPHLKNPSQADLDNLFTAHKNSMTFHSVLQYLCHIQLKSVKEHANKANVFLKGDIPILISPDSADVWLQRELFDLSYEVGHPPDLFHKNGQHWGFPALRWDILKKHNYSWWKQRLQVSSSYYHIYRIDHVAGFYRLWLIPHGKLPIEGAYYPSDLMQAIQEGHTHLSHIVPLSPMLPIAEDLGNIPKELSDSLRTLGISGTKVLRWMHDWDKGGAFSSYDTYPPLSMSCVSTHDSETLSLWWENHPEEAKKYCLFQNWEYTPFLSKEYRLAILQASHSTSSLFHINLFQEYLALFPELIHSDPAQERINIPGSILPTNWTYRFRCDLNTIFAHDRLRYDLETILAHTGLHDAMQQFSKKRAAE